MKFSITPDHFQAVLGQIAAVVPTRTTTPILTNVLVEADEHGVRFSATDLDIGLRMKVPAQVEEPGHLAVPAKKLLELARLLPTDMVHVEAKGQALKVRCGKANFSLHGMPAEEYPTFPQRGHEQRLEGSGRRAGFHDRADRVRGLHGGVPPDPERCAGGSCARERWPWWRPTATAWPGSRRRWKVARAGRSTSSCRPRPLAQVRKLFGREGDVQVARTDNHIAFRRDDTYVFARLIEGPYPNYAQVIPRDNDKVAILDNALLQSALRRVAVVASEQTHRVRLAFDGAVLRFAVDTPDLGDGKDEMEVEYTGEPIEIGFNATYLIEVLKSVPGERVQITLKAPERASLVSPVTNGDGKPAQLALIMPLRLHV
jgi:DNA polymerase III subunit beta